ncbi:cold shock domain-containing protein [Rheinheimera muenzenbergensis]|uniref:Cold shock domain-containing protein n=1 Tax=Rheinheimera muenzenbergensis TaxID=1193628 RepID=A0ABU8CBT8_9GAMM
MQLSGTVVSWHDDKGFGFVKCDQSQQQLFFHIRDQAGGNARPEPGDRLHFTQGSDKRGRPIASQWRFSDNDKASSNTPAPASHSSAATINQASQFSLLFRLSFLAAVVLALLFGKLPYVLPLLYIEASLMTYWLYKTDKEAAIARHGNRLAEESLQLFALIGGWPGAYIAQQQLAHKRSKLSFRREFGFVILGNALLVSWLLSPWGQAFLARMALWAA